MIITATAIKGGSGKTATVAALAQAAVQDRKSVLTVDLDPQGNLSSYIGGDLMRSGTSEILHGENSAKCIQQTEQGIDLLSASLNLSAEKSAAGSAMRLRKAIEHLDYDLILVDSPPMLCELTYNAIYAADEVIIPLLADPGSLQGLYQAVGAVSHIQKNSKHKIAIKGSVITAFDRRSKINRFYHDTIEDVGSQVGAPLLITIRQSIAVKESLACQESLFKRAPKCNAAKDYQSLYTMLISERRSTNG